MVFQYEDSIRIWDLWLLNPGIKYIIGVLILVDLKEKLKLLSLSECLTNIRNLEGMVDLDNILYMSGVLAECLPGGFL
jgi:hypothetical protein